MGGSTQGTINGSEIIRTECGQRTGETIYTTQGGRRWTDEVPPWHYTTTGIQISQIEGKP